MRAEIPAGGRGDVGLAFPDGVSQTSGMSGHLGLGDGQAGLLPLPLAFLLAQGWVAELLKPQRPG